MGFSGFLKLVTPFYDQLTMLFVDKTKYEIGYAENGPNRYQSITDLQLGSTLNEIIRLDSRGVYCYEFA